jgi:hypothetical protein
MPLASFVHCVSVVLAVSAVSVVPLADGADGVNGDATQSANVREEEGTIRIHGQQELA